MQSEIMYTGSRPCSWPWPWGLRPGAKHVHGTKSHAYARSLGMGAFRDQNGAIALYMLTTWRWRFRSKHMYTKLVWLLNEGAARASDFGHHGRRRGRPVAVPALAAVSSTLPPPIDIDIAIMSSGMPTGRALPFPVARQRIHRHGLLRIGHAHHAHAITPHVRL